MKNLLRAFSDRSFLYLWLGEVFTLVGANIFNFLLIIIVFALTKSNVAVSGIVISFTLPAILFGILAGVYVDHWDKKKVLIVSNIIRALLLILLAFMHTNLVAIYIISFIFSIVTQFFIPAETPMIPLLVSKANLLPANALFGMGIYGSVLIAYILAGPMLLFLGQVPTYVVLAGLLFLGAFFISLIKYKRSVVKKSLRKLTSELDVQAEVKNALRLMVKNKAVYHSLFLLALSQILILIIAAVTPGYADKVLQMDVEKFPLYFVTPAAIGMVIGAITLVHYFPNSNKERMINVGLLLSAVSMLILPFASILASKEIVQTINTYVPRLLSITDLHILIVLAFFLGISNALVFVPANTILQQETTDESRGKIYGVLNALVGVFSLIPIILVGSLSDLLGVGNVILGIGLCLLGIATARLVIK